jgi:hypothetical protein
MPYKNREQRLEAQRLHYKKNKEKYLNNQYLRRLEKAKWFFDYKSTLKCERCPETHHACLQFHHKDPINKEGGVCELVNAGYAKDVILKEIAKCAVICSNCHLKLHWQERLDEGVARISPKYSQDRKS